MNIGRSIAPRLFNARPRIFRAGRTRQSISPSFTTIATDRRPNRQITARKGEPKWQPLVMVKPPKDASSQEETMYSPIFIRDCCTCPKCLDPSTQQKLFATTDIPTTIQARETWKDETHLNVKWDNDVPTYDRDHITRYPLADLTTRILPKQKVLRTPWNAADFDKTNHTYSYEAYMTDDATFKKVLDHLYTHGLVFLKDVPESKSSVEAIATRVGPLKNTFYGNTWDVRNQPAAKNVAYTNQHLGFHMDLLYMFQPPRLQFLHCLKASPEGGTSLFTDAIRAIVNMMRTDMASYEQLRSITVPFHYENDGHRYNRSRTVINQHRKKDYNEDPRQVEKWSDAELATNQHATYWSPPFQGRFPLKSSKGSWVRNNDIPAPGTYEFLTSWHKAARVFHQETEKPEAIYRRQMPPGECVIFDNLRVLHARTAFSGDSERWLRGAYVDSDAWRSTATRVARKLGGEIAWAQDP